MAGFLIKIGSVILLGVTVLFLVVPIVTHAAAADFSFVTCGRDETNGTVSKPCTFQDLVILIVRIINYLIAVSAVVVMYEILTMGFNMITSLGNEEKIKKAKEGLSNALVGFGIVIMAFVFVNLLVNGVLGKPGAERNWWDPACIQNITNNPGCPLGN